jgi:phosphate-selective porin OprO/OprP
MILAMTKAAWAQNAGLGTPVLPATSDTPAKQPNLPPPSPSNTLENVPDWKWRFEQLEQQNKALQEALLKIQAQLSHQPLPTVAPAPAQIQAPATTPTAPLSQSDVQKIVGDYLNAKDEQAKVAAQANPDHFVVGRQLGMTTYWNNGLWTETADKAFKIHVGGRTQLDYVGYRGADDVQFGAGGVGRVQDGVNFRRARLEVDGTLWEVIDFFAEYEFLGNTFNVDPTLPANAKNIVNTPGPTDLWATLTHLPVIGNVRVGNHKPPISLEHLTSSRFLDFLERSYAFDTYCGGTNNGFLPGVSVFNWTEDERITWHVGIWKNNQTVLGWNVGGGEWDVTGRVTWLPIYEANGRRLVHLGLGVSNRGLDDGVARLRARTLLRNGPFTLQTRLADVTVSGDNQTLIVPEFAAIAGPFMIQAEYFGSWIQNTTFPANTGKNFGTTYTQSAYVQTSYFLTGEHRPWNMKGGSGAAPGRVIPNRNFFMVPGQDGRLFSSGAWQVAARFSWIDLANQAQQAGNLYDVTLGLNWFLNPNMKFQWNYDYLFRNAAGNTSDGPIHGFGMRFAMDF